MLTGVHVFWGPIFQESNGKHVAWSSWQFLRTAKDCYVYYFLSKTQDLYNLSAFDVACRVTQGHFSYLKKKKKRRKLVREGSHLSMGRWLCATLGQGSHGGTINNPGKSVPFPVEINSQHPGTSQDLLFFFDRNTHKGNRNQFSNFVSGCERIPVKKASYCAV